MKIKKLTAVCLAVCMVFTAAACGSNTAESKTESKDMENRQEEVETGQKEAPSDDGQLQETEGEVKTAAKLVAALSTDPGSNFPMGMKASAGLEYLPGVYQQLFASDGKGGITGIIGESFEMQEDDELTYIMKIRDDGYDTLGNHMTASDVIWSINYNREVLGNVGGLPDLDHLEQGEDDYTIIWHPHEMDGGRRQRVGVGRGLSLNPKFICCDEPVSALDVSIQAQVLNLLHELQKEYGLTYMFVTHDMSVVRHISDDISVMYLGQLVETSPAKELFKNACHPYTKALLSAIPSTNIDVKKERIILKGELTSPINPDIGCRFAGRCIYATEECRKQQKLEEVAPDHFVSCCRVRQINPQLLTD